VLTFAGFDQRVFTLKATAKAADKLISDRLKDLFFGFVAESLAFITNVESSIP
jgi:hypothetical protein